MDKDGGGDGDDGWINMGMVMRGWGLTTWERPPLLCWSKIVHKKQFWKPFAHSFRQGSVTWLLGYGDPGIWGFVDGDADGDMDEDGGVDGD